MAKKSTKGAHGGPRPGSGRPKKFTEPKTLGIVMERADYDFMEEVAAGQGKTISDWAREKLIAAAKRAAK